MKLDVWGLYDPRRLYNPGGAPRSPPPTGMDQVCESEKERALKIRNFEANLLSKVCMDVETEPSLQPITAENLGSGNIITNEARLDIRARGFWHRGPTSGED